MRPQTVFTSHYMKSSLYDIPTKIILIDCDFPAFEPRDNVLSDSMKVMEITPHKLPGQIPIINEDFYSLGVEVLIKPIVSAYFSPEYQPILQPQ